MSALPLKAIAFGYEIKILEPIDKDYYGMPQTLQTRVTIPKEVLQNNIQVMLKIDSDYDKAEYMPKETYTANQSLSLKIDEIKLTPLETKERNMLDNIVYAKKVREQELAQQQNQQAS
ncbi:hypothetical protein [Sulfurimonas sp.]|uniref:hypothetical protein n=1 Tax=Sulfurimonas sp. TaxID=2022749 RepID=UPI003D0DED25